MLTECIRAQPADGADEGAEDIFSASLGTIFRDDAQNCHGDPDATLIYTGAAAVNPKIGELKLTNPDPHGELERRLFAHYLWNASLWVAQANVQGSLACSEASLLLPPPRDGHVHGGREGGTAAEDQRQEQHRVSEGIDVRGRRVLELGAGLGLAGILSCLAGADDTTITDYPSDVVLQNIRSNVARNVPSDLCGRISVAGHRWGNFEDEISTSHAGRFTIVIAADCLWMSHEHHNLARSISFFLSSDDRSSRAYVVAGFHTGRAKVAAFFDVAAEVGLAVERIWEEDVDGKTRAWAKERDGGSENVSDRKRWLVVAILRKKS